MKSSDNLHMSRLIKHHMAYLKSQIEKSPDEIDWNCFLSAAEQAAKLSGGFHENVLLYVSRDTVADGPSALYISGQFAFEFSGVMTRKDVLKFIDRRHFEYDKKAVNYRWYKKHKKWPDRLEDVPLDSSESWKFSVHEISANITIGQFKERVKNAPQDKPFVVQMVNDSTYKSSRKSRETKGYKPMQSGYSTTGEITDELPNAPKGGSGSLRNENTVNKPLTNEELHIFEDFVNSAFENNEHYRGMMIPGERKNPGDFLKSCD